MSGDKYILDTCTVINFLSGKKNFSSNIQQADLIGVSIITEIEFLSSKHLSDQDIAKFKEFLKFIEVFDISTRNKEFIELITNTRKKSNLKLPDCIIACTAISNNAMLITSDKEFHKVEGLQSKLI